jgi:hypothetical protein
MAPAAASLCLIWKLARVSFDSESSAAWAGETETPVRVGGPGAAR